MKISDIKFPEPKKPNQPTRRERAEERFLTDSRELSLKTTAPPPRPKRFFIAVGIMAIIFIAAGIYYAVNQFEYQPKRASSNVSAPPVSWAGLLANLKEGKSIYGDITDFSSNLLGLFGGVDGLRRDLPAFIAGRESHLIQTLESVQSGLGSLSDTLEKSAPLFNDYVSWNTELARGRDFTAGLIDWLKNPESHHVILILSNTSELRPGGGFIGSFADLEIANGILKSVTVRDINEVDRAREKLVVPPAPLQAIAGRWRAADANWFFDHRVSAAKTLQFMEESALYGDKTIDGTITITPEAVRDILEITGPIILEDKREINADNFLVEIQKEVQAGQSASAAAPKEILAKLAEPLRAKIAELGAEEQDALISAAKKWIINKDILIYAREPRLARFLAAYNLDGALFALPGKWSGDYLAVVNANIGGGKTDLYMEQAVKLDSSVTEDGLVHDALKISRAHHGDRAADWWYKETNWNYLQVFTPRDVKVDDFKGGGIRNIEPKANYKKDYAADPEVETLERTLAKTQDGKLQVFEESDRNVFATWQKIAPGETKTVSLDYSRELAEPPRDGAKYTFVFEKQSGARTSLEVNLTAPVGFIWAEADSPIYKYKNADPPGRVVINLTFKKK